MNKYVKYGVTIGGMLLVASSAFAEGTTSDVNVGAIMSNASSTLTAIAASIGTGVLITYAGMKWGWNGGKMAIRWVAGLIH